MTERNGHKPKSSRYVPTYFRCYGWHNLTTQEGPLQGDIFNLGDVGTGKTTWTEGVQAALTLGDPRMQWNSAGSHGLTKQEQQEDGRDLSSIILRYNDGKARRDVGIGYFAVQLTGDAGDQVTVGIGCSTPSPKSRVNRWGFVFSKSIGDVAFTDAKGNLLDRGKFEDANGEQNVYNTGEYLAEIAGRFFGNPENYELVMGMWNLGKSYDDLARRARNYTHLFREILAPPNEQDYQEARTHLKEIRELSKDIEEREKTRDELVSLQKSVDAVRRHRATLVRYEYFQKWDDHATLKRERTQRETSLTILQQEAGQATQSAQELERKHKAAITRVKDLEATGADELMGRRKAVQEERDRKQQFTTEAGEKATTRRNELAIAERELEQAWNRFDTARTEVRRGLAQIAKRHEETLSDKTVEALRGMSETLSKARMDEDALPSTVETTSTLIRDELANSILAAETERVKVDTERKERTAELETKRAELGELERMAEVQPVPDLDAAMEGIRDDVRPLYRLLVPKSGNQAELALLESYLPPHVLAALVPKRPSDTIRIRNHVAHSRHVPQVKVVDVETIATTEKPGEPVTDGILTCLDAAASDATAYSFLVREYGDVHLLDETEDREARARVVWRNGDVYDGTAYHLQSLKPQPEFIGPEARQRALERRRNELRGIVKTGEDTVSRLTVAQQRLEQRLKTLRLADTEIRDTLTTADLPRHFNAVVRKRGDVSERTALHKDARQAHEDAISELKTIDGRLQQLLDQIKQTGAETKYAELDQARQEESLLAGQALTASNASAVFVHRLKTDQQTLQETQGREADADAAQRSMIPLLRQLASEDSPPSSTVEDWLRTKKFYELKREYLEDNRNGTRGDIEAAKVQVGIIRDRIKGTLPLDYDSDRNLVVEVAGTKTLADHLEAYALRLREANKRKTELITNLNTQIIVKNMARHLDQDQKRMRGRIDEINRVLADNPIGRRYYQIRVTADNEKPDLAQMRKYVEDSRQETKMEVLAEYIRHHLLALDANQEKVPAIFDFRQWYQFEVRPVPVKTGQIIEGPRAVDSGGEQAIPKYLICFALFHLLYESLGAKLRLVILDEAFDKVAPKEISQLLVAARRLGLTVIATSNKLEPIPVEGGSFTTQMFYVNKDDDTIIERFFRVQTGIGGTP